jgi:predicted permease
MFSEFIRDLRYGLRLLRGQPGFTAVVVATLAIATGASVTVFSLTDAWLVRPLNFPRPERLVVAFAARPEQPSEPAVWLPYRTYLAWKDSSRSFTSLSAAFVRDVTLTTPTDARTLLGLNVTPEFFRTFAVDPMIGRALSEYDDGGRAVVVLSYGFWHRQFGGSFDAVGTTITLSGVPHEIVGVMPRDFETRLLDMRFEFWTPFSRGQPGYGPDGVGPVALIARLRDGIASDAARAEVAAITREAEAKYRANFNTYVVTLASLQADNSRTVRATLVTVSAAASALFLVAAMNVGTLLLGRGLGRIREVAIRAAVGSGRGRLVRQLVTESLLISTIGGLAGLGLAAIAMRLFVSWNPLGTLPANAIQLDLRGLAAAGLAIAITTIACGLVPAWKVARTDPQDALRSAAGQRTSTAPTQRTQVAMLVGQTTACVVLLVATTLLVRTFARLQNEPLGFEPRDLSVANVVLPHDAFDSSEKRIAFVTQMVERLGDVPGILAVAASTSPPLSSGAPATVNLTAEEAADAPRISMQEVTTDFFATLAVPVIAGRAFDARDQADAMSVAILNANAARQLFGRPEAAIGQRVRLDREDWREIVGVVGNVRSSFFNTLEWRTDPIVYRPVMQGFNTFSNPTATSFGFKLHVRSDHPLSMSDLQNRATAINARAAVTELQSVTELIALATQQPAFRMRLLAGFAIVSLLLAGIGMYGLVSQAVAQRRREIAIRLALGASPTRLVPTIMVRAMMAALAGVLLGSIAASMLGETLEALLYGVQPRDALSFTVASTTLLAVSIVAAFLPALGATRVDPIRILRGD